jgi:phosphate transport system protein
MEPNHPNKKYEQSLRMLKDMLLLMAYHAEQMISDAMPVLTDRRADLAAEVVLRDDTLDALELDIDRFCNEILALQHPVAGDLRFVATAFKIVRDLERIGDIAVNIAERSYELIQEPPLKPLIALPLIGERAQRILKDSLDAFVEADERLAEKVIRDDEVIDAISDELFRELLTYMIEKSENVSRAMKLIFIAKHLERVEKPINQPAKFSRGGTLAAQPGGAGDAEAEEGQSTPKCRAAQKSPLGKQ